MHLSAILPGWIWNLLPKSPERPSITTLAHTILMAQSEKQAAQAKEAENALKLIVRSVDSLETACYSLGINADWELRSIIGKAYAARRRVAKRVFVDLDLED